MFLGFVAGFLNYRHVHRNVEWSSRSSTTRKRGSKREMMSSWIIEKLIAHSRALGSDLYCLGAWGPGLEIFSNINNSLMTTISLLPTNNRGVNYMRDTFFIIKIFLIHSVELTTKRKSIQEMLLRISTTVFDQLLVFIFLYMMYYLDWVVIREK